MDTIMEMDDVIQAFQKALPYLPFMFDDEVSIALTDKTKFLYNQSCESLPLKSEYGDPIPEGGAAFQAIKTSSVIVREVSEEVYGAPFKSYSVPLKNDDNEVVGSILVARNLNRSKNLLSISRKLTESFEQITSAVTELSSDVQEISLKNKGIADKSDGAIEYTKSTNEIIKFINGISSKTNLLGVNTAIEAARLRDSGGGFQVIAQEIRKMSASTAESIKTIEKILVNIEESVNDISENIKDSNSVFHGQVATLEEITASMAELFEVVKSIESLAEQI